MTADLEGQEPHNVDPSRVEALAGFGLGDAEVARVLGLPVDLLTDRYGDALINGRIKVNARVAENLYRKATGDGREAVTAAIFWLKTRASWKEGSPNGPEQSFEPVARIERIILTPLQPISRNPAEASALPLADRPEDG